ncbi:hypothetical protein N474_01850 [Pseudoalteromonas luteoviolacea CPMOR-2]|uniref:Uncharacterized protein n=1 Tax=Pseudoalteromonas luteoviolacea DSM 6061 TaxID=1365250 RepID=A0A166WSL5_9GAMM|nr:hypothetical protein [Pseudoalteromonas luteoviolacea]KZN38029.1 hypothetical protein N475_15490 [Pseudoalteromonas luteoviolacea DSM 6061]KZN54487.1 hypothetical protein N474_01850 [Pseudoalteromonas luteoviolacea CPMOR-2]MBE0388957.1 hypothetical protein [Pseudoalteromonas luteoviolacea DSM 6061]
MKKIVFLLALFLVPNAWAAVLTVNNASVTSVKVYETPDDSLNVWLFINGQGRIGPNPDNTSVTCELWTHDKTVHSTALAALMSGKKVSVSYVDRGDKSHWCKVRELAISAN